MSLIAVLNNDLINNDGILYIKAAKAFLESGLHGAYQTYNWPFYPILIAWCHRLTGIGFEHSAYLVNAIALVIASVIFVHIFTKISPHQKLLWVPILVVLALPVLGDYREDIIRGPGFWALILLGLASFINYVSKPNLTNALYWQSLGLAASLFRVEGTAFLAFAPLYFIFARHSLREITRHFIRLYSIVIPIGIICLFVMAYISYPKEKLGYTLLLFLSYMQPTTLIGNISKAADGIQTALPHVASGNIAIYMLLSGLITFIAAKIIIAINPVFLAIMGYGHHKKWIFLSKESYIVLFFAGISILPLIVITGNQYLLSSRYTVLTGILFALISTQYIHHLIQSYIHNNKRMQLAALLFILFCFLLDGAISTGTSKKGVAVAGKWVTQNLPENARIACAEPRFAFYADDKCDFKRQLSQQLDEEQLSSLMADGYEYLVLWVKHDDTRTDNYIKAHRSLRLIQTFPNNKGDEARIYRLISEQK